VTVDVFAVPRGKREGRGRRSSPSGLAGANEKFSDDLIDGPDNLVRIPTLKHWQINGWYGRRSDEFGGLSPRDYLRGKSWEERRRVGINALTRYGVLKP
jgi:hypothetical protein